MKIKLKCNVKKDGILYVGGREYEFSPEEADEMLAFGEIVPEDNVTLKVMEDAPEVESNVPKENVEVEDETTDISMIEEKPKTPAKKTGTRKTTAKKRGAKKTTKK